MKLSVVINTKNAAKTVEKTLKSVKFADEIVVVDMHSSDETVSIVQKYTDKIFAHEDVGYVEPARNFAIKKALGEWILIVDADEEVPPELEQTIQEILQAQETGRVVADCYYLPRKNIIFNKAIQRTGWWPDYVLRLFRKGFVSWSNEIHSIPITKGTVVELPAIDKKALIHHNYQHVDQYLERLNRYTSIQAQELTTKLAEKKQSIDGAYITRKFYAEFLSRLFAQNGIADGTHGVSLSFLQGLSELVVSVKSWEKTGFLESKKEQEVATVEQLAQCNKELAYWIADWQVKNSSGLKQLIWKIRRKFYI